MATPTLEQSLRTLVEPHARAAGFAAIVDVEPAAAGRHDAIVLAAAGELVANAARHSGARQVLIAVRARAGSVELTVADDGSGPPAAEFARAPREGGFGLAVLTQRVERLGGVVHIRGGAGTLVRVTLPIEPGAGDAGNP